MSAPGPAAVPPPDAARDAVPDAGAEIAGAAPRGGDPAERPGPRRAVTVLGDRVLVAPPDDAERRSKGGILIPATARSVDRKGIWGATLGVGPHVRHVEVGDEVLYLPEDAIEVDVQGEAYLIVRERDVHAVGSTSSSVAATGLYL
jgi:chaperonin GroES